MVARVQTSSPAGDQSIPSDLSPVTGYDPRRPFYGPVFLDGFLDASLDHGNNHPDWSSNRLVLDVETDQLPEDPPFLVYVLNPTQNQLRYLRLPGPPELLEEQVREKLGLENIEWLESPITYRLTKPGDPNSVHEETVVLFRTEEKLQGGTVSPEEYYALAKYPNEAFKTPLQRLQFRVDARYIASRYGRINLGAPEPNYSARAASQAFQRLHPNHPDRREEWVRYTPVVFSPELAMLTGASIVILKDDSGQRKESFKERGARNRFEVEVELLMKATGQTRSEVIKKLAIIAFSHGNHGQAVAMLHALHSLLVLPLSLQTQKIKIRNCLAEGSMVYLHGKKLKNSEERARQIVEQGLKSFLSDVVYLGGNATDDEINAQIAAGKDVLLFGTPDVQTKPDAVQAKAESYPDNPLLIETYNDVFVSVGQGTDAMELLGWFPFLLQGAWTYVVPVGGAGKIAGDGTYIRRMNPVARVVGVRKEPGDGVTFADGIDVEPKGKITARQASDIGAEESIVTEDEIAEVIVFSATYPWYNGEKKLIEGASATTLASVLNGAVQGIEGKSLVLSITGRNIDEETVVRAFALKGWVATHPDFYKMVCRMRKEIRRKAWSDREAEGLIRAFNSILNSSQGLQDLMREFSGVGSTDFRAQAHPVLDKKGGGGSAVGTVISAGEQPDRGTPHAVSRSALKALARGGDMLYPTHGSGALKPVLAEPAVLLVEPDPEPSQLRNYLKLDDILVGNFRRKRPMTYPHVSSLAHFTKPFANRPMGRLLSFTR